jgi:hypothetical protein
VAYQVLAHAAPGKIIVIHDGDHRNPRAERRHALMQAKRQIVDGLRVSKAMSSRHFAKGNTTNYHSRRMIGSFMT